MKKIASIGLLVLLLYNTFGLPFAVFFFEQDYRIASGEPALHSQEIMKLYVPSLPYSDPTETSEGLEGMIRKDGNFYNPTHILHENDTLYVTLQSNQAARDHFFELANAMEILGNPDAGIPQNPYGKIVKLLNLLVKNYVPAASPFTFQQGTFMAEKISHSFICSTPMYSPAGIQLPTPPPEQSNS